jgi:ClpP class serine protease
MIPLVNLQYKLHHAAWYIAPAYFQSIKAEFTGQNIAEVLQHGTDVEELLSFFVNQRAPLAIDSNGIAVLTLSGVLANDLSVIDKLLGFTDYADIQADVADVKDQSAKALLIDVDSPGGESQGAIETASAIAALAIPKASYSSGMDASAAYFLTSSADRKFVSPSAFSGSIGTLLPWIDESKFWDALGLAWEPITGAGETFKGTGGGPSLSDAERVHLQGQVNSFSAIFRSYVAQYRELDHSLLQGGAYFGQSAIELNLADQIGSYDQAYQWLLNQIP